MTGISSVSSAATTLLTSSSFTASSGGDSSVSDLQARIAAKQATLSSARTDEEKAEIEDEIAELKAELATAQAAEKQKAQSSSGSKNAPSLSASTPLSGKSERIGTVNFTEDTPFGERTAWV